MNSPVSLLQRRKMNVPSLHLKVKPQNVKIVDLLKNSPGVSVPDIKSLKDDVDSFKSTEFMTYSENRSPDKHTAFIKSKRYTENVVVKGSDVILEDGVVVEASRIFDTVYASSAPTVQNMVVFWKMILERDVSVIVALTSWIEKGTVKADQYVPSKINEMIRIGEVPNEFTITKMSDITENVNSVLNSDLGELGISVSVIHVTDCVHERLVFHLHHTKWPDMSAVAVEHVITLLKVYDFLKSDASDIYLDTQNMKKCELSVVPVPDSGSVCCTMKKYFYRSISSGVEKTLRTEGRNVKARVFISRCKSNDGICSKISLVHCSAGLGRTGTFLSICSVIARINHSFVKGKIDSDTINFSQVIEVLRTRRLGLVQTYEQMKMIIEVAKTYLKNITVKGETEMISV